MSSADKRALPRARRSGLQVQETGDELLVYDLERHRAHGLSPLAAAVFRRCDGKTPLARIASGVAEDIGSPADAGLVRMVLARLDQSRLLESTGDVKTAYSRREFANKLKRVGLAASVMLPAVTSIVAPTPAHAMSCVPHAGCGNMPNCTPCENPGGNCNGNWRCCDGECKNPGKARKDCGC